MDRGENLIKPAGFYAVLINNRNAVHNCGVKHENRVIKMEESFSCWGRLSSLMEKKKKKGISTNVTRRNHLGLLFRLSERVGLWKHIESNRRCYPKGLGHSSFPKQAPSVPQSNLFSTFTQNPCIFPSPVRMRWRENVAEFGRNILQRVAFELNSSQRAVFSQYARNTQWIKCIFTPWKKQSNDSSQKCFLI